MLIFFAFTYRQYNNLRLDITIGGNMEKIYLKIQVSIFDHFSNLISAF